MNNKKIEIVKKYILLEKKVFGLMSEICSEYCKECEITCCTPVICKDILKSKWLFNIIRFTKKIETGKDLRKFINKHFYSNNGYDKPCPFAVGRPAICGQYFCKAIISNLENNFIRFLLFQLADIIPYFLNQRIFKQKILNMDLYDDSFRLTDEHQKVIGKYINLALRKFKIIKKYIFPGNETADKNTLFEDIMFLEKHSEQSIIETFSSNAI